MDASHPVYQATQRGELALAGFLGAIGMLPAGRTAVPSPSPDLDNLTAGTIHDLGLQVVLPKVPSPHDISIGLPDAVLWAIVALAVAALLWCLKDVRWRGRAHIREMDGPRTAAASDPSSHLAMAERFAEQGSFVEAMHELLLEGFREIRERAGERLADSLTSREILRATLLPEQARAALRAIVAWVELTWFGERTASLADYRACRDSFDTLRAALRQA